MWSQCHHQDPRYSLDLKHTSEGHPAMVGGACPQRTAAASNGFSPSAQSARPKREFQLLFSHFGLSGHVPETGTVSFQPSPLPGWKTHSLSQSAILVSIPMPLSITGILASFPVAVLKYSAKGNLVYSSRVQSINAGRSRQQELEAAAPIPSTTWKQRAMHACCCSTPPTASRPPVSRPSRFS